MYFRGVDNKNIDLQTYHMAQNEKTYRYTTTKNMINITLLSLLFLLAHSLEANEPNQKGMTSKYNINLSFKNMRQIIDSTAENTLKKNGTTLIKNCKHDKHCVVLPYNNGCKAATFSNYDSVDIEQTLEELTSLYDFDITPNKTCKKINLGGICSSARCVFRSTAARHYN